VNVVIDSLSSCLFTVQGSFSRWGDISRVFQLIKRVSLFGVGVLVVNVMVAGEKPALGNVWASLPSHRIAADGDALTVVYSTRPAERHVVRDLVL
jgi:hypothetical protein